MTVEFFDKYKHKIKTRGEVCDLIGDFPRDKKVIMCHGVFDVVHPGHVRHLAYAKSKVDLLIASITSDRHIKKGVYRPHVPENLRALNLAAFEMVDYVIVDENPKPLENLEVIKPDFFAKGFEYSSDGLPPATQEEMDVVETYGGQLMFTPGDVVYSSSNLIDLAAPNIKIEKLITIMHDAGINFSDLRNFLTEFSGVKVHVVGDTIVDSYTRTTLIGGQTKTPTLSVLFQDKENYVGGAGIVSQHLCAAGADVVFSTVLGDDELKNFVFEGLTESGVDCRAIIDPTRPTTNKNAIIAGGYRLLKVDTLDNRAISDNTLNDIVESIRNIDTDAVLFSDFRHGIFNQATVQELTNAIPDNIFCAADSQVASRWGNITEFRNFDLITPNEREARFALADQDSTVGVLAGTLVSETQCKALILKLGDRGVFVSQNNAKKSSDSYFSIDSFADNVVDPVGAGDALLAYATLAMITSKSLVVGSILGSMAAAVECEIDGNVPVKTEDVVAKINSVESLANYQ
jgi:rfaE bifunctional protein kinase chain/domain